MNTTTTRHTTAALATATAAAAALTILSAIAPTTASAQCLDTCPGSATLLVGSLGSAGTVDIALDIAHRKAELAQYYLDHPLLLRWAAR
jgi:hypothetical protein